MLKRLTAGTAIVLLAAAASGSVAREAVTREDGVTRVDVPTTKVRVDEETGATRVRVRTQDAAVDVDTDRGKVRIRVPYFNGDIRW